MSLLTLASISSFMVVVITVRGYINKTSVLVVFIQQLMLITNKRVINWLCNFPKEFHNAFILHLEIKSECKSSKLNLIHEKSPNKLTCYVSQLGCCFSWFFQKVLVIIGIFIIHDHP